MKYLKQILRISFVTYIILFSSTMALAQLFPNSDFEIGLTTGCNCPTGYTCFNDAGRVVDSIHPLYISQNNGCVTTATNYTNWLGSHSGSACVYFYAGSDQVSTPNIYISSCVDVQICVWYAGPQFSGPPQQGSSLAYFSLGIDGQQVGPSISVPVNTPWTQHCITASITPGLHNFNILSGGAAMYSFWFDDFTVDTINNSPPPYVDLGPDTAICQGDQICLVAWFPNATYQWSTGNTAPFHMISQAGTYWVTVTDSCTSYTDSITISYLNAPQVNLGPDTIICSSDSIVLSGYTPNSTYLWQNGSTSPNYTVTQSGTYWVQTTNACGQTTDSIDITFYPPISLDFGADTSICFGDSLILDASSPNATYSWQNGSTDSVMVANQSGYYFVIVNDSCSNIVEDINLVVANPLGFDLGNDTTLCEGDSLELTFNNPAYTFQWSTGSSSNSIIVDSPSLYWVKIDSLTCSETDSIFVDFSLPPLLDLGHDTTICHPDSIILTTGYPGISTLWSTGDISNQISVKNQGIYWVNIANSIGCYSSDTIKVEYLFGPDLGPDLSLCDSALTIGTDSLFDSYLWSNGFTTPAIFVDQEGWYILQVAEQHCLFNDSIYLSGSPYNRIYVPNAFTPDGDGLNDDFKAVGPVNGEYRLMIYDRFGKIIYTSQDIYDGWDGTFNGNLVPTGVYVWQLEYFNECKETLIIKSGSVHLIR